MDTVKNIQCMNVEKYLDKELSIVACDEFEAHLAKCDDCREFIENWQYISTTYGNWTIAQTGYQTRTPDNKEALSFVDAIKDKIDSTPDASTAWGLTFNRVIIGAVAASFLIGVMGFMYFRVFSTQKDTQQQDLLVASSGNAENTKVYTPIKATITQFKNGHHISKTQTILNEHLFFAHSDERLLVQIGHDTIGLNSGSVLQFEKKDTLETSFLLQSGFAAFQVAPLKPGSNFTVTAADVKITVIGTQFSVHLTNSGSVIVSVSEGLVVVEQSDKQVSVPAGNQVIVSPDREFIERTAKNDQLHAIWQLLNKDEQINMEDIHENIHEDTPGVSQKSVTPNTLAEKPRVAPSSIDPDIKTWHQMIIDGRLSEANFLIRQYLQSAPNDSNALMLLATCHRKAGNIEEAYKTYNKVIAIAKPSVANRARYIAGEIAQSQMGRDDLAVELFDAYLSNTSKHSPNWGEAKLRLSKALRSTGNHSRAKMLLQEIITEYGRAPVANRARELLEATP